MASDKSHSTRVTKSSFCPQTMHLKTIAIEVCRIIIELIRQPTKTRSEVQHLLPQIKKLEFFKQRSLSDHSMADIFAIMKYKEVKKDDFVVQYGEEGNHFFIILEGQCEVLVPPKEDKELL